MFYTEIKGQPKKNKEKHDDYETPEKAWDSILHLLPKDKIIYEPFYLTGNSGRYLKSKGLNIIHESVDFYTNEFKYDMILSNPPYGDCKSLFKKLKEIDKPFMLLLPSMKVHTQYISRFFKDEKLQIAIPRKRIHFIKYVDGFPVEGWVNGTSFDCVWFCYKMNLPRDILFLER